MATIGPPARVRGVGDTAFGRHDGRDTLDLMAIAATNALQDAGIERAGIDGLLTGYSTAMPHLMLATLFSEHFGLSPSYAHGLQAGGATGCAALMLAKILVESGQCRNVLVVAGENRLTNDGDRDSVIQTLAQVGHPRFEVPYGTTIPAYYGLLASQYMDRFGLGEEDLAELAVLMRAHAGTHFGAQFADAITIADVMSSRPIATPLKLLDCCPISDGAVAVIVSGEKVDGPRLAGAGQAHLHQHVSMASDIARMGAADAAERAFADAGVERQNVGILGVYDSFTITVAMLLEEIGFSGRGNVGQDVRDGRYGREGALPLNLHGGLLSYGHSGVAGGLAHFVEVVRQMSGRAGERQLTKQPATGFVHGDGGVLSAHVSLVLRQD